MSEEENQPVEDKTPGLFTWREVITQDVEGSTKFYTELLGWSVESMDMGDGVIYNVFMQGERPMAGMIKSPKEDAPTTWINYITVEDLEATVEKAQALGAHLCMPIAEIPGKGRYAGFADPQGGMIGFWQYA